MPRYHTPEPEPTTTPAPLSVRDWVLLILDERARAHAAEPPPEPPPTTETQGNLCACLVTFAAWRRCCVCGSVTLYVNPQAQSDGDVECTSCVRVREELARQCRAVVPAMEPRAVTCLPVRAALHLWAIFGGVANENGRARA